METDSTAHVRRLQEDVDALKELLAGIHQTQQQQFQLFSAFLAGQTTAAATATVVADTPTKQQRPILRSIQTTLAADFPFSQDGQNNLDSPIVDDLESRLQLETFKEARDRFFQLPLASQRISMRQFMKSDYVDVNDEEDPVSAFLALVGPANKPVHVRIRDYYSARSDKLIQHDIREGDEVLWNFLAMPRANMTAEVSSKIDPLTVTARWGMKVHVIPPEETEAPTSEEEERPPVPFEYEALGRDLSVKEITPNTVLILKSVAFQKSVDTEPISSLSTVIDNTLSREPITLQAVNINFKHQTFLFSASFMEHSSGDKSERRNPISYIKSKTSKPKVAFGAKLRASFLASPDSGNGTDIGVRESTASIVFDTLEMRSGTYWTIHSIGDYEEALALKWLDQAKQGTYTSPQEVFLDKLARIIDFAVDKGMSAVLKTLEYELDGDSILSQKDAEKLLFDNQTFSKTKNLQWSLQLLRRMQRSIYNLLIQVEDFEKTKLDVLKDAARDHRIRARSGVKNGRNLISETAFRSKLQRVKQVNTRIEAKYNELKDLRDALVSTSGVMESRVAVSQAETVQVLTVLTLIYLPASLVIGLFGMEALPAASQNMKTFGIILGLVFIFTSFLGLGMGSVITLFSTGTRKLSYHMQKSMEKFPGAWSKRSSDLKEMNEAWRVLERERGKQVPAVLYFVWFCCVRFFIVFPASELRQLGGLITLFQATAASFHGGRWIWNLVLVPFRIAFLPFDLALVGAAYVLLVLFTGWIVGWTPNELRPGTLSVASLFHPNPDPNFNPTGTSVYTVRAIKTPRRKVTAGEALLQRFKQPFVILCQYSSYFPSIVAPVTSSAARKSTSKVASASLQLGAAGPRLPPKSEFYQVIDESLHAAGEDEVSDSEGTDYEEDDIDVEERALSATTTSEVQEVVVLEEGIGGAKDEEEMDAVGQLPPPLPAPSRLRMGMRRALTTPDLEWGKRGR
ncbi:hypothetical protein BZA05DRAFT_120041 [Tricharina praecox]|uniref:uncharacterized protein n=1 Tax=Tricharina praecox TaxID=43433 RepID=UPI00222062A3|nr:uncharacterized protein BZA05DRAFT_120041 [Tricharina praecox]KAI5848110.1 hypothetical protein BZA05DRAFT_120041 [Tricharina praecox]